VLSGNAAGQRPSAGFGPGIDAAIKPEFASAGGSQAWMLSYALW